MRTTLAIMGTCVLAALLMMTCTQRDGASANEGATTEKPAVDTAKPRLTSIQWLDSALDKGKVKEGEKVEVRFRFRNTGKEQLVISNVVVSCGCTVAEKPEKPVAPGEEGSITASFDSKGRPGPNHKTLTVYSNTEAYTHTLMFDVEVIGKQ